MSRFGADVFAWVAIAGGAVVAVGATAMWADAQDAGHRMRSVDEGQVRVEVRHIRDRAEVARHRAEIARERGERARERAQRARERAERVRERAHEVRVRAAVSRDVDFELDFDFDFDYDFEAGELRMQLEGLEGLEELTLDLTDLELLFEGLDEELDLRFEGLDGEWEQQLEAEMRRLEEQLAGLRVEVKGR